MFLLPKNLTYPIGVVTIVAFALTPSTVEGVLYFRNQTDYRGVDSSLIQQSAKRASEGEMHSLLTFELLDGVDIANTALDETYARLVVATRTNGIFAFCAAFGVAVSIVAMTFYPLGSTIIAVVLIHIVALASMKHSIAWVFSYDFSYPKFVSALQLLFSCFAAFVAMLSRRVKHGLPIVFPTKGAFFFGILPIALIDGLSIGVENSVLALVPSALSQAVGFGAPIVFAFLAWAFGLFPIQFIVPIVVVVIGCLIFIPGKVAFSFLGFSFLLGFTILRGLKLVLQQRLMQGQQVNCYEPVTIMAWTCLVCSIELFAFSSYSEGLAPLHILATTSCFPHLALALGASCVNAFTLNLSSLFLVRHIGAVGVQMVEKVSTVVVVIIGVTILSESLTVKEQAVCPILLVIGGAHWYAAMIHTMDDRDRHTHESSCRL